MQSILRPALVLFAVLTLICGVFYPLAVTGIAQAAFPVQANGSLVERDGKTVGSALIGQSFTAPGYFWGRPSATGPMANNGGGSGGSNQGPLNPALQEAVKGRVAALRALRPVQHGAGTGRPGDRVGQRSRSRDQRGGRAVPGGAGGACARDAGRTGRRADRTAHRAACTGLVG